MEIVDDIGMSLLDLQGKAVKSPTSRKDFVTNADLKSHRWFLRELKKLTPKIQIFSEEDGKEILATKKSCWIIDPLDGTINYFHQLESWGVSVALVSEGQTQLGVVFFPALGELIGATYGENLYAGSSAKNLCVRDDADLSQAQIWTDHIKGPADPVIDIFGKLTRHTLCPQVRLCATYSLLNVAFGNIAGYVHPAPKPEDIAAACLIVENAGGKVTDIQGNPWTPFSKSIVATNGLLHDQLLSVLNN